MRTRFICFFFWLAFGLSAQGSAKPEVITYGHDGDVPLPFMVGGSDLAFTDWTGNGLKDLLVSPNGESILLRRNVGSVEKPRFANVYEEEYAVLKDPRVGRFFTLMHAPGVDVGEGRLPSILCFEKHAGVGEIGSRKLKLNLFVPHEEQGEIRWDVMPAYGTHGQPIEDFADVWISPTVTVVDWTGDGREDLLVGAWHPSIAQPNGAYTYGYNHPDESWNPYAGRLYLMRNVSTGDRLVFEDPVLVHADGNAIATYGFIYPQVVDIDGDGRFDLLIGEQRPGLRWYRNVGTKGAPEFEFAGLIADACDRPIESVLSLRAWFEDLSGDGHPEMITASYFAFSMGLSRFDQSVPKGRDLSRGWRANGMLPMVGSSDTPVTAQGICTIEVTDWNGNGVRDLLLGAEPGTPMVMINRGSNQDPVWDVPRRLRFVNGEPLEYYGIEVGRGSVWGPIEFYLERTLPRLADWDGDGTEDMLTGSMAGRLLWLPGRRVDGELRFEQPRVFTVDGQPVDAAHRVQPVVMDLSGNGYLDIVALDAANVLTRWEGRGDSELGPGRAFKGPDGEPLKLNPSEGTVVSGRRGLAMVDWDGNGTLDLITYNAFGPRVWGGEVRLHPGCPDDPLKFDEPVKLFDIVSHHNGGIALVDWNEDGYLDILIGGDHHHLPVGSEPRGQFFIIYGRDLPIPPARR